MEVEPAPGSEYTRLLRTTDEGFMRAALALGLRNLGRTWPNPSVGAVVVVQTSDGPQIITEGMTAQGGRPHAERIALDEAGRRAQGATLYVTLEPCAHHGRTAPCVDAVIAAGVKRVVAGILDPDLRVAGQGFARLREAGIEVDTGVLAGEASHLHRGHLRRVVENRPDIILKLARTRDGYAASPAEKRLIITGQAANARVHMMRSHADAILIGVTTANADNPRLDVRLPGMESRSPIRVIFDSSLRIRPDLHLIETANEKATWVIAAADAPAENENILASKGVEVLRVDRERGGRLCSVQAMRRLAERGISSVLCEGGPTLAAELAKQGLVDEVVLVTGDKELGSAGLPALLAPLDRLLQEEFILKGEELAGNDVFAFHERRE